MKRPWPLVINVIAWAMAVPVLSIAIAYLGRTAFRWDADEKFFVLNALIIAWAALIYWYVVPSTESPMRRIGYATIFVIAMSIVGSFALAVAFFAVTFLFGA